MVVDPLSGWGLRPVEPADRSLFDSALCCVAEPLSDYSFSQIFTWRNSLRILWRTLHDHLCVFANGTGDLTLLLPPIAVPGSDGRSDRAVAAAMELMDDYNAQQGVPDRTRIEYVSQEMLARLGDCGLEARPLGHDYIYDTARMIDLAGGDLASKRQARSRFLRLYPHRVEEYDQARHLGGCLELLESWRRRQDDQHAQGKGAAIAALKRQKESLAAELTLRHAEALSMRGLVVTLIQPDGSERVGGFTFGEPLGPDQASIVVEKTDLSIKGLAQFIFAEFCRRFWSDRPLVNVGDDWGIETLAWTKMSYRPVRLLPKYSLCRTAAAGGARQRAVAMAVERPVVHMRPARIEDVPDLVAIEQSCFDSHRLGRRQLLRLMRSPSAIIRVAESTGQLVGEAVALVRRHPGTGGRLRQSGRIYSLAVRGEHRGQGLGGRLLDELMLELGRRGVGRVFLEVDAANTAAQRIYEQRGFIAIGTLADYYAPGRHALHMRWEMPAAARAA